MTLPHALGTAGGAADSPGASTARATNDFVTEVITLKAAKAADITAALKQLSRGDHKILIGGESISGGLKYPDQLMALADEPGNLVAVSADRGDMPGVREIISQLDAARPQILLQGLLIGLPPGNAQAASRRRANANTTASADTLVGRGIVTNALWVTNLVDPATIKFTPNHSSAFSYIAGLPGNYDSVLKTLEAESRVTIFQRPRLQTSSGVAASFPWHIYYADGWEPVGDREPPDPATRVELLNVTLEVTPSLAADGGIVLDIRPFPESESNAKTSGTDGASTNSTNAKTFRLKMHDHDAVLIGGAMQSLKPPPVSGVPILKSIPYLGVPFRSHPARRADSEIAFVLSPSVIPAPADKSGSTNNESNKAPTPKPTK